VPSRDVVIPPMVLPQLLLFLRPAARLRANDGQ
jgi:hypothetical protein